MIIQNIKGSSDSLPKEQIIKNKIIKTLTNNFETYGYLPLETTTICYYDLLASKYAGGAEILKEVYKLTDQGKRNLALRYDLTVPFAKVISMNKDLNLPFKRYEIGKVYRDGPVKLGRCREFYQCDVDVCGIEGPLVEAELLSLADKCYKDLGIDIYIEWNNRKLLSGLILECGIAEELLSKVILSVDKLAKIGEEGVKSELKAYNIDDSKLNKLFNFFKLNIENIKTTFTNTQNELLITGINEVYELNNYLNKLGLKSCKFTPYLARGLEIYTATVWEVFDANQRITCAIGGGGRYDKIITNFINDGQNYPAVGMSFGLVPIYEIITANKEQEKLPLYNLYIIPMDTDIISLKLANTLRSKGLKAIVEMNKKKIKKCFEWANKNNIPYVTVIGENEISNNTISIKNMQTGTTEEFNIDDISKITKYIQK